MTGYSIYLYPFSIQWSVKIRRFLTLVILIQHSMEIFKGELYMYMHAVLTTEIRVGLLKQFLFNKPTD